MIKIFVSVGAQLPFNRLVESIDKLSSSIDVSVVVQAGYGVPSKRFKNIVFVEKSNFVSYVEWADIVVSHAGMGNIICCSEIGKKIIVVPRLASKNEHRNDHQVSTCNGFKECSDSNTKFQICWELNRLEGMIKSLADLDNDESFFRDRVGSDSLGEWMSSIIL